MTKRSIPIQDVEGRDAQRPNDEASPTAPEGPNRDSAPDAPARPAQEAEQAKPEREAEASGPAAPQSPSPDAPRAATEGLKQPRDQEAARAGNEVQEATVGEASASAPEDQAEADQATKLWEAQRAQLERALEATRAEADRLRRMVEDKETQLQKTIAAYKKAEANFERAKQRLEGEIERRVDGARGDMVARFFGVLDDLERSLETARKSQDPQAILGGVELVYRNFLGQLQALGVERYDPTGEAFDPSLHEAMGVVPVPQAQQNNRVVQVYQPGYRLGDQPLRAARVLVGKFSG